MIANCFRQNFECVTKHKLSMEYSDTDEKLYGSDFAESIGSNIFDSLLRRLICVHHPMHLIHDRYVEVAVIIYKRIYDRYKVSQKNVKEGIAYAFLSGRQQLLSAVAECLSLLVLEYKLSPAAVRQDSNMILGDLTKTLADSSHPTEQIILPKHEVSEVQPEPQTNVSNVQSIRSAKFKNILQQYLKQASDSQEEDKEEENEEESKDSANLTTEEYDSFIQRVESFEEVDKHDFEEQLRMFAKKEAEALLRPIVPREPSRPMTRPIDVYKMPLPSYFTMPDSVQSYLSNLQHIKTQLNYFHQLMKTNLPRFEIVKIGNYFKASCILDFQTPQYYRSVNYKEVSELHTNSDHAKIEAARKVLVKLYTENPQRWREFLIIKFERKIVC